MRIMGECYVERFAFGLERRKGGRCEVAQPNLFVVQMRENRFQVRARNITHIMLHYRNDIPTLSGMSFFNIPLANDRLSEHFGRGPLSGRDLKAEPNPRLVLRG